MLPPAPDVEKAGADNDEARASAAGKPAKRPSLKGKGDGLSALAAGSGESNGESRGGSRETSGNSGKLKARAKSMRADWGNDHEDVELSNVRLQPMTDDPAMAAVDSPMGRKNTKSGLDRWAAVQAKTKLVGKMAVDSQNAKHYGVELDMNDSFNTSHEDVAPEVNRMLYVNPDGQFRSAWDIAQVIVLFYLAWVTPYRVGFDAPAYGPEFWFEFLVDIYFIVDVFMNFITGFWRDTETTSVLVSEPREIALNYLKTWFLIDIVACAPVDLATRAIEGEIACSFAVEGCVDVASGSVNSNALKLFKLLRIFRLLKLLRLFRVSRLLSRYQNTLIYYHSFISVGRVNLLVILISHWIGCLFGLLHNWDAETEGPSSKSTKWLRSVYWAVQSITSVGYGDIPAENPYTQVLALFTMLIGVVLVSWIMTNVLAAMNPDSSARRFHERLQYVLAYLKNNQLPAGVAKRVITFYRWQNMNQFDEKSVLSDLPAQLRKDIFDNLYTGALQDVPIFAGCSSQFMTEISLRMSPISFPQFQNVYCQGELGTKMYFITKGSVALILREVMGQPNQEDFIQLADSCVELCRGSFFGEAAVLGHPSRLETIVTTRSSTMMTLGVHDMADLCQLSFEFKAKLCIIAFERMRRNRTAREIVEYCAREFGLDPDDFIAGTERADDGEDPHVARSISTRYNGATRQVVFVEDWKTLVVDRVVHSMVATLPKIFQSLRSVGANVETVANKLYEMDRGASGSGSPSSGETLNLKTESQSPHLSGSTGRAAGFAQPLSRASGEDVTRRLAALEDKIETLIKLVSERG
jgi:hyperpolarization activated cyclic nucleotide-gated potassium channel 2